MLAEIAETKDNCDKSYGPFVKCMKFEIAELLRFNTSKPGDEQISFKEYVDRVKEGQNDIFYITGESLAVVSSSLLCENLRKNGYEVPYMAGPMDEYAVHQPKEFNGMKPKSTTKEGLDLGDQDEKKTLEEMKIESEPLRKLMKETLGDKVEEVIVSNRTVDSLCVLTMSEHGLSAIMKRIAQQPSGSQQQRQSTRQERGKERKREGERGRSEQEKKDQGERESVRKGERGKEEGRDAEEEKCKQVEKDATGWTLVTRNKRQKKMAQIFVKVNGPKATPMEVSLTDDKVEDVMRQVQNDEDVYATMHGKMLKGNEKLKSCGVTDGCTIQVTSRKRGGGRHKDKKSKVGKKQVTGQEPVSSEGLAILESEKEAVIRMLEENEEYRKIVKMFSEGSDEEYGIQYFTTELCEKSGLDASQMKVLECGLRWAVEARRKKSCEEKRQQEQEEQRRQARQEQSEQGKQVRFGDEEQFEETRAESTDEQKVTDGLAEVRTGRGSAGLVRGGDERCRADETSRKGKGKGNGGKGEHASKGATFGGKGFQQSMKKTMKAEEEQEADEEDERDRVAPNMGAGGSHPQATSVPRKEKVKKETRVLSWADCNDEEVKENEQEVEQEKETRQWETTEERPPGLEAEAESESKTQQEKKPSQVENEQEAQEKKQRRAQEAREQRRAQEAREEERRAQVAREQKRAQEAREEERRAQEAQEQTGQGREVEAQGRHENDVKAQDGALR